MDLVSMQPHVILSPNVYGVTGCETKEDVARTFVHRLQDSEDWDSSFFLGDLGKVVANLNHWSRHMPRIRPYYAMKCNPCQPVVQLLASLGVGFDCASKFEIQSALKCGVTPDDILFAVPCKMASHIQYAKHQGVLKMTFDNADELYKIKLLYPTAKLLLRIAVEESSTGLVLGDKFGATMEHSKSLILLCVEMDLELIGVSFHAGSGANDTVPIRTGLSDCRQLYDFAKSNGIEFKIIDIGGGFMSGNMFEQLSKRVNEYVDNFFPASTNVTVIAEPGRFFVENAFAFLTPVHGKARVDGLTKYYIGAGKFSTFFSSFMQGIKRIPTKLSTSIPLKDTVATSYTSKVYGPTCAGDDIVIKDVEIPEAHLGDWWLFENMGAYAPLLSLGFNGYLVTKAGFYISKNVWEEIAEKLNPKSPLLDQYRDSANCGKSQIN